MEVKIMAIKAISASTISSVASSNATRSTNNDINISTNSVGVNDKQDVTTQNIKVDTKDNANRKNSEQETYDGKSNNSGEYQIQEVSPEKVKEAINAVNQKIRATRTECRFSYHEDTKRISIKVIDQTTGDTIREIPPEKTLDMIAKVWEMAGLLVDEKR